MKTTRLSAVFLASCALAATMFAPAYMKLGDIKGESTDSKHKDWIIIESMSSPISAAELRDSANKQVAPRDAASGMATGKRQHKPFVVTKLVDKASPKLAEYSAKGTVLPNVEISDGERIYKLKDVIVSSVSPASSGSGNAPMETLSLNYSKIEWRPAKDEREVKATKAVERAKAEKPVRVPN